MRLQSELRSIEAAMSAHHFALAQGDVRNVVRRFGHHALSLNDDPRIAHANAPDEIIEGLGIGRMQPHTAMGGGTTQA